MLTSGLCFPAPCSRIALLQTVACVDDVTRTHTHTHTEAMGVAAGVMEFLIKRVPGVAADALCGLAAGDEVQVSAVQV